MENKKALLGSIIGTMIVWLLAVYLLLGIFYHLVLNPQGSWLIDLLIGGFKMIRLLSEFVTSG